MIHRHFTMTMPRIEFVPLTYIEDDRRWLFSLRWRPRTIYSPAGRHFLLSKLKMACKITFNSAALKQLPDHGSKIICSFLSKPIENKLKRCQEFQSFIRLMKFESFTLLDNTVTEIELRLEPTETHVSDVCSEELLLDRSVHIAQENRFLNIADRLGWTMREDPSKIMYPPYVDDPSWPTTWVSDIETEEDVAGSAVRVQLAGEKKSYICKKNRQAILQTR
jgi:hypothetical protein